MKLKIGLNGITLFLVFLVLKLTGVIGWSWWWITAPLWIPVVLFGIVAMGFFILLVVVTLVINDENPISRRGW